MGIGVSASCQCGYRGGTSIGSGMSPYWKNKMLVPALCSHCREIVTIEVKSPLRNNTRNEIRCPECSEQVLLYDEPSLSKDIESLKEDELMNWGDLIIPRFGCKCPRCGNNTISFEIEILWD